ncbi:MAG: TFIIB-type zinc ribbon-containing protein [Candidatus Bathyarchaeia archaeon]
MQTVTSQEVDVKTRCPECGSGNIVRDEEVGELVCGSCGLVITDEIFDRRPERRAYTLEEKEDRQRTGRPTDYALFDKGLSTAITIDRDTFGRALSLGTKQKMWRLRKWHIRAQMHDKGRNLMQAMDELQRLADKLNISQSVRETAAIVYRKALDLDLVKGRSIQAMIAAALYVSCRLTGTPKGLDEISEASLRDKKEISRCYRLIIRELGINMPIHDPMVFLSIIADRANVSGEIVGLAAKILREAKETRIVMGKDPRGLAAAILYIACKLSNHKITQKQIAMAAEVTEVTIRNRKRELLRKLKIKIKD